MSFDEPLEYLGGLYGHDLSSGEAVKVCTRLPFRLPTTESLCDDGPPAGRCFTERASAKVKQAVDKPFFVHMHGEQATGGDPFATCVATWADLTKLTLERKVLAVQQTERVVAGSLAAGVFGVCTDLLDTPHDQQGLDDQLIACTAMLAASVSSYPDPPFAILGSRRLCDAARRSSKSSPFGDTPFVNASTAFRFDVALLLFQDLVRQPSFAFVSNLARELFPSTPVHDPQSLVAGFELIFSSTQSEKLVAAEHAVQLRHHIRSNRESFESFSLLKAVAESLCIGTGTQPILAQAARIFSILEELRSTPWWPTSDSSAECAQLVRSLQQQCTAVMQACTDEETSGPFYFAVLDLILSPGNGDLVLEKYMVGDSFVLDLCTVSQRFLQGSASVFDRLGLDVDPGRLKTALGTFLFEHKDDVDFWLSSKSRAAGFSCLRSVVGVLAALPTLSRAENSDRVVASSMPVSSSSAATLPDSETSEVNATLSPDEFSTLVKKASDAPTLMDESASTL